MNTEDDDFALISEYARERSETVFCAIVDRHSAFVITVCRQRLLDTHLAEDAAQKVFMILAENCGRFTEGRPLRPYLFKISLGVCSDFRRSRARRERHEEAFAGLVRMARSGINAVDDRAAALDAALDRIPRDYREAIELRYILGSPLSEVASSLNISPDAAKKRLTRGIARLRALLSDSGFVAAIVTPQFFAQLREAPSPDFTRRVMRAVAQCPPSNVPPPRQQPRFAGKLAPPIFWAVTTTLALIALWLSVPSAVPYRAAAIVPSPPPHGGMLPPMAPRAVPTFEEKLHQPFMPTRSEGSPFGPSLESMSNMTGVPIDFDWRSLKAVGVSAKTLIFRPADSNDLLKQVNEICDAAARDHRVECLVEADRLLVRARRAPITGSNAIR